MSSRSRAALAAAAAAVLAACGHSASTSPASGSPAATPAASAAPVPGPKNAPVESINSAAGIPLDPAQAAEVKNAAAKADPKIRARLRYALALTDAGTRRVVVYDPGEHPAASATNYVVPQVLNASDGSHYDPLQNAVVPPLR